MTQLHACHAPHMAASQPAAPGSSFMTSRAAQWIGLAMLCEVFGLIVLIGLA